MLVDQGTKLWLWTEDVASTYALRVVNSYWRGRNGPKCVICKTREPDAFKALFPEWDNFIDEAPEDESVQVGCRIRVEMCMLIGVSTQLD